MATVEGLFNFDEKLLARQVVKNRESAAIGQNAPTGWGPMMMGMNKIGNAIFNSDDKILNEQTIAQTSLKETMEMLGDDAKDSTKLYDALGQRLVENGASAETLMKLKSVASEQAQAEAKTEADIAYKQQVQDIQKSTLETNTWVKQQTMNAKERKLFEKATTDPNSTYGQALRSLLSKLSGGADMDKKGYKALQNTFVEFTLDAIDEGENAITAMRMAEDRLRKGYKYQPDTQWYGDNSGLLELDGNTTPKLEEDQDFLDLVEQKRTK
jgi:hypothetical protein